MPAPKSKKQSKKTTVSRVKTKTSKIAFKKTNGHGQVSPVSPTTVPWGYREQIKTINSAFVKITSWRHGPGYKAVAELYDKGTALATIQDSNRDTAEIKAFEAAEAKL
ncbi:MAG: hypothetical protein HY401_00385 [Elusimicrobia bacterium]|nr:hypothetical protein [Elusimicrobiota bacterium]